MIRFSDPVRLVVPAIVLTSLFTLLPTHGADADVPDAERHEVEHLLDYLRSSGCTMERNGERHSGADAYVHVKKKYDYFRGRIETTEDFIEYSATKSTLSGSYYRVICPGDPPVRTRDWLLEELRRYRG
jgi:hypothetical protein